MRRCLTGSVDKPQQQADYQIAESQKCFHPSSTLIEASYFRLYESRIGERNEVSCYRLDRTKRDLSAHGGVRRIDKMLCVLSSGLFSLQIFCDHSILHFLNRLRVLARMHQPEARIS